MNIKPLSILLVVACLLTGCSPYQVRVSLRDQAGKPVNAEVVATNHGFMLDFLGTQHDEATTGADGTSTLSWAGAKFPGRLRVRGQVSEAMTPDGRIVLDFVSNFDVDQTPFTADWKEIELQSRHLDIPGYPTVATSSDDRRLEIRVEVTER